MVAALIADGFRNYFRARHRKPAEERVNMLTLTLLVTESDQTRLI
jgi:hypothetical protein